MKKTLITTVLVLVACAAALLLVAWRFESKIRPNTMLGQIPVGGLSLAEASQKLSDWWLSELTRSIPVHVSSGQQATTPVADWHIVLDEKGSIAQLPVSDLLDSAKQAIGAGERGERFPIRVSSYVVPASLRKTVENKLARSKPARVVFADGAFKREPEKTGTQIDESGLKESLQKVLSQETQLEIPLREAPKQISDEMLAQITDVESSFTTRFPTYKVDRNTNIRIAASKLNGTVIPPGGTASFNTIVGRRTIRDGFRQAPVFKNGKHDMGVGGGICQVSSTLYNSALFSNLKIVQRHNHSMPVPYLPVGRDATVDYGSLDLVIQNNQTTPIAISSELKSGTLTFRILGKKDRSLAVKIEASDSKSWDAGLKTVQDPKLPAGKTKVIEKGTKGRSINTYRVVYKDGVEIAREPLGKSYYKGGIRILAVGTKPVLPTLNQLAPAIPGLPHGVAPPGGLQLD